MEPLELLGVSFNWLQMESAKAKFDLTLSGVGEQVGKDVVSNSVQNKNSEQYHQELRKDTTSSVKI